MAKRYQFKRELCRDPEGDYYLMETVTDTTDGHVVAQKDIDVLVWIDDGGEYHVIEYKQLESETESISDVAR